MPKTSTWILLLCYWLCLLRITSGKAVSGDVRLSGASSEKVLTTFAVLPSGGRVKLHLSSKDMYENERNLKFRLYRDVEWPKFLKALTCREKIKNAQMTLDVAFQHDTNSSTWKSTLHVMVFNSPEGESPRSHYWYFVIDDCSLEEYMQDNRIPMMHFDLLVFNHVSDSGNELSHLSADEHNLTVLHSITLIVSGIVAFLLTVIITLQLAARRKSSVHLAVLWVASAAALDAASSFTEIMHLQIYKSNGVGSAFIDSLAAHCEAICDALIVLLLLSIAAGWTLPSDVITVNANANSVQKLVQELSAPITSLRHFNAAGALAIFVLASHVILAHWGRNYEDHFESYHDFEHPPGKILMFSRVLLGFLFLAATMQTRLKCSVQQLKTFYGRLAAVGFFWFQSLPVLTWVCNQFVPYYLRHPVVYIGSALLQSGSILLLAWLVTAHSTTYHHFSHMSSPTEKSLTDSLTSSRSDGEQRTWSFGKAKVRLD